MKQFPLIATAALMAASALCPAWAQKPAAAPTAPTGPGTAMLVLDASGSMWGQIQGRTKIEIAREAVGTMLQSWPRNQQLGLMAYGHRSKGNCADIEMLKGPATVDAAAMQQAVNALQPKGMTPISAAVRMAAEQLKFSERKATVILVSDGEETCHADPCALGAELEKLGVDFTAHVVGFDIDKNPKAKAQLQCLASSTGGRYLDAKDAGELNKALREVAQAPAPAPAKPKEVANLKPPKGCLLYDQDNYKGESVLLGASGYDNEMPPGWDNRVRSLKCSTRSGLYLYNDKNREGEYLMTGDGAEMTGLGAVASSYIYFGTFAEEEDVLEEKKK